MAAEKQMKFGAYAEVPNEYVGVSGAIAIHEGRVVLNGGAAQAMTVALPTTVNPQGVNIADGAVLKIVSASAFAHTVTTPANGLNGNKLSATFANVVGSWVELTAVNGIWVVTGSNGITLA
jgi:hypothetical protein